MMAGGLRMQDLSTMTSSSWMGPRPLTSSSGASCTCVKVLKELWLCTVKVGVGLRLYYLVFICFKLVSPNLLFFEYFIQSQLAWAVQAL